MLLVVEVLAILALFEDTPSAPFSIHALATAGARGDAKKKVGDWVRFFHLPVMCI